MRKARGRFAAWVLLVAGGVFVAGGKWYMSSAAAAVAEPSTSWSRCGFAHRLPRAAQTAAKGVSGIPTSEAGDGIDLAFVDELVERFGRGREAAIPILQAIQSHYRYLPDEALRASAS